MGLRVVVALLLLWTGAARAADIVDATGRTVTVPDHIARIVPAGPPAAVLLAALAPDLMAGWPEPISDEARALLSPAAAKPPQIPRLTGRDDVTDKIKALKPDLILDYGTVSPRYADLAKATQQKTGIPTVLLDGSMTEIPKTLRTLGAILHREDRAETLAHLAEAILALPLAKGPVMPSVVYVRGADGLSVAAPGTDVTEVFDRLGWRVLAPPGEGIFRQSTVDGIRALNPDVIVFADPKAHDAIAKDPNWKTVRAVHTGYAFFAPDMPFGWVEEPPSINRLLALAWLGGSDPGTLAALFNAVVYGHVLTPAQHDAVLAGFRPVSQ
jgi:iron complex transport system substrate-binding protein